MPKTNSWKKHRSVRGELADDGVRSCLQSDPSDLSLDDFNQRVGSERPVPMLQGCCLSHDRSEPDKKSSIEYGACQVHTIWCQVDSEPLPFKNACSPAARYTREAYHSLGSRAQQRFDRAHVKMLGNPNADNPFATSDPFGPSRAEPASDDFDTVDFGNNAPPTSSGLYSGSTNGADLYFHCILRDILLP